MKSVTFAIAPGPYNNLNSTREVDLDFILDLIVLLLFAKPAKVLH